MLEIKKPATAGKLKKPATAGKLKKPATAGTLESSDILVTVEPDDNLNININSSVDVYYHDAILNVIESTLDELGIKNVNISVVDKGALDCTIRARVITAVRRACGGLTALNEM